MAKLRDEILQAEQARMDLLKWKLLLAGAIGATGLGLAGAEDSPGQADLVLCAVPLICVYVDLACWHLSLRILVIGGYFRACHAEEDFGRYEMHVQINRNAFALEDLALRWSTIALSIAVLGYGIVIVAWLDASLLDALPFFLSAATGGLGTWWAHNQYEERRLSMDDGIPPRPLPHKLRDAFERKSVNANTRTETPNSR